MWFIELMNEWLVTAKRRRATKEKTKKERGRKREIKTFVFFGTFLVFIWWHILEFLDSVHSKCRGTKRKQNKMKKNEFIIIIVVIAHPFRYTTYCWVDIRRTQDRKLFRSSSHTNNFVPNGPFRCHERQCYCCYGNKPKWQPKQNHQQKHHGDDVN